MKIIFSEYAVKELEDAVEFYDAEYVDLGQRFKKEIKSTVRRISDYPQAWSIERGEVRKCLLHKFPYKLLYSIESDHIFIIAVAHLHREPEYWVGRENRREKI